MPFPLRAAASFFLIGEVAPFAPATFASLALLPVIHFFVETAWWWQAAVTIVVVWLGVLVSTRAEAHYGHDASPIVIDEVAGMLVTFLLVALPGGGNERWIALAAGFLYFRVFDIVKPFPAGRAQDLPGGRGVMTDDLIAGVYANLALRVTLRLLEGS
jgi:phosphatidylglycerophosphatase A